MTGGCGFPTLCAALKTSPVPRRADRFLRHLGLCAGALILVGLVSPARAREQARLRTRNVILVTTDGLRQEEVFRDRREGGAGLRGWGSRGRAMARKDAGAAATGGGGKGKELGSTVG